MSQIKLMSGKLHRITVTESNHDYVGSITIDSQMLSAVGILPLEEVEVVNINNGERWSTYVLPGEPGLRRVCPNGGGALLCKEGDILIVWANEIVDRREVLQKGHSARVFVSDKENRCEQLLHQTLDTKSDFLEFSSTTLDLSDSDHPHIKSSWTSAYRSDQWQPGEK